MCGSGSIKSIGIQRGPPLSPRTSALASRPAMLFSAIVMSALVCVALAAYGVDVSSPVSAGEFAW